MRLRDLILELKEGTAAPESLIGAFEVKLLNPEANDGVFEGYASLFGKEDQIGDVVMPGAFKKSLARRPAQKVKMLYQHSSYEPVGFWSDIKEDDKGLYVKGQLLLDIQRAREAHVLMKADQLSGLSIGFRTVDASFDKQKGTRYLKEVDLWEISPVTFPCLVEAGVTSVKTDPALLDPRAWEQAFRDGGLSSQSAKIAVSVAKKLMAPREEERPDPAQREAATDAIKSLRKATALFQ